MNKIILLAINRGGVIVGRHVVDFVDDESFEQQKKVFGSKYPDKFTTFLTVPELKSMLDLVERS